MRISDWSSDVCSSDLAILARSLHLPLVVGAAQALQLVNDGDVLAVDGSGGTVVIEPNAADLRGYRARVRDEKRERKQLHRLRREPSRTVDGVDIRIRSDEHTSELQSLMRISYAVFC